jgi:hypothetical protein
MKRARPTPSKSPRDRGETTAQADRRTAALDAAPHAALLAVARPASGDRVHPGRHIVGRALTSQEKQYDDHPVPTPPPHDRQGRGRPRGELAANRVGRLIRISEADLFLYLQQGRR